MSFKLQLLYCQGKNLHYLLDRRLGGIQNQTGRKS
jgi:hypothetical protein